MIPNLKLSKAERTRLRLVRIAQANPQSIPAMLDSIKSLADEALRDTLNVAQREALTTLKERLAVIEKNYEKEFKNIMASVDKIIGAKVAAVKPPKGDKGDMGPAPSAEYLLSLIRPLIPQVKDGKTPTKEELTGIAKSLLLELVSQDLIINRVIAEHDKEMHNKMYGNVVDLVAQEISKIKRFGGGGSGDRIAAGTGVSITTQADGKKRITATGVASVTTPVGTVNGVNQVFTVTGTPSWVVADGITYYENAGYTRSGTQITMDIAPSQYIRAMI